MDLQSHHPVLFRSRTRDWRDAMTVWRWARHAAEAGRWPTAVMRHVELVCWELARVGCLAAEQGWPTALSAGHQADGSQNHLYLVLGPLPEGQVDGPGGGDGDAAPLLDQAAVRSAGGELRLSSEAGERVAVRVTLPLPREAALPVPVDAARFAAAHRPDQGDAGDHAEAKPLMGLISERNRHLLELSRLVEQQQTQARQLTRELEETNRGVVALYAELEDQSRQLQELNATLEQRVADRTEELERRARQLRAVASQLSHAEHHERRRIAQMLHDGLQQFLVAGKMRLNVIQNNVEETALHESLEQVLDLIHQSIEASRTLTVELAPPVLFQADLKAAMEWLGERMDRKHGLKVYVAGTAPPTEQMPEELRVLLFQITQELLFNVVKHAEVDAAEVFLKPVDSQFELTVVDRGRGFDVERADARQEGTGFGLLSVRERLEWYGGSVQVESAPGWGTRITLCVPLTAEASAEACSNIPGSPSQPSE